MLVFSVLINAQQQQCTEVSLLVDDQSFTDTTLYKPVGSSVLVSCQCNAGSGRPDWLGPDGMIVLRCVDMSATKYCVDNAPQRTRILSITSIMSSVVGEYTCKQKNATKALNISVLG